MYINNNFHSTNHSPRIKTIEYIILHYTEMPFDEALSKLIDPTSKVSTHYLINQDGNILQLVEDDKIAWHAGESSWQNSVKLNENSIGIEIDNLGNCEFSTNQMESCINLCLDLVAKYNIPPANIIGHSDIAPDRKIDPGIFFGWKLLAKYGLGIWYNEIDPKNLANQILFDFGQKNDDIIKLQQDFQKLGYKLEISGQLDIGTSNVIRAFQSHFCPEIIHNKGGIDFYNNLASVYNWDSFSSEILKKLIIKTNNRI